MPYQERRTTIPGAVLWQSGRSSPRRQLILPDGCLDLIWDGSRLFVAGPDTAARWHQSRAGASHVALRFSAGTGPALLGVLADELSDRTPDLEELWSAAKARTLADWVAQAPSEALEAWAAKHLSRREVDALGPHVLHMAAAATPVAVMANRLNLSVRQLHRRCLPLFRIRPAPPGPCPAAGTRSGPGTHRHAAGLRGGRLRLRRPSAPVARGACADRDDTPGSARGLSSRAGGRTGRHSYRRDRGPRHSACPRPHPTGLDAPQSRQL